MKNKIFLYSLALLSAMSLYSCNEDFDDWADPQKNEQQEAGEQLTGTIEAGKDNNIICDNIDLSKDSLEIFKFGATTAPQGSTLYLKSFSLNDKYTIPFTLVDGTVKVSAAQLDSIAELSYKSRASVERDLVIKAKVSAQTPTGEGVALPTNDLTIKLTPPATPEVDPAGYSLVGDIKGWDKAGAIPFVKRDNNIYVLETETIKDDTYFKLFKNKGLEGADLDWSYALGSQVDGDNSGDNFIVWTNPQAIKIDKAGKYKITLDMTNYRFTVKDNSAPTDLYMTGEKYGWGKTWNPFTPINGQKGQFWGIFYFGENEPVKFSTYEGWDDSFGFIDNISAASIERAGLSKSGDNLKVGKAGWYVVYINATMADRQIEFETPDIYMIGDCTGGWDAMNENFKFTIPTTADGLFTSPKTTANGDVRMYIHINEVADWWRAEFKIINGKIVFRGAGNDIPDQSLATAGQSVTLNFPAGTGTIE